MTSYASTLAAYNRVRTAAQRTAELDRQATLAAFAKKQAIMQTRHGVEAAAQRAAVVATAMTPAAPAAIARATMGAVRRAGERTQLAAQKTAAMVQGEQLIVVLMAKVDRLGPAGGLKVYEKAEPTPKNFSEREIQWRDITDQVEDLKSEVETVGLSPSWTAFSADSYKEAVKGQIERLKELRVVTGVMANASQRITETQKAAFMQATMSLFICWLHVVSAGAAAMGYAMAGNYWEATRQAIKHVESTHHKVAGQIYTDTLNVGVKIDNLIEIASPLATLEWPEAVVRAALDAQEAVTQGDATNPHASQDVAQEK